MGSGSASRRTGSIAGCIAGITFLLVRAIYVLPHFKGGSFIG